MAKLQRPLLPKGSGRHSLLYRDVAEKLRLRIASGKYLPNSKLPPLSDLVEEFKVSEISVRRALRELSYEGLVYGEQGRGIFIKPKSVIHRVFAADAEHTIGDEIERAGFKPTVKELKRDQIAADGEIASRLRIVQGTKIYRHQKLVYANEEPVSLHFLYLTDEMFERLKDQLNHGFAFAMLKRARLNVAKSRFGFASTALSAEYSALFEMPAGFPMGVVYFTPLSKSEKPFLTGTTIYRSDRFVFDVDVHA
ncbi:MULTISPECIES: GntR family transcriptional regulator [Afipia]|uniref:DNA-binding GntR family transcriptional regulator n=1 Tax=Afipia massiliensis TaxID=211460 RepID=A0A840NC50_9BRAD|nr:MULTISPECIES: GntR family transcriptional regulator [Afipia]MBB5055231.1 DNA-binding GntR family transcriptional regulator [Afipia massiliensis]